MITRDLVGQRSETAHRANLSAIARELHDRGPLSRSELVARTGLTRSTIRALIGEFALGGLIVEETPAPAGAPGRPSPLVRPNPDSVVVLALDIEVDSLAVAVVGFGGDVLERIRVDRPRGHTSVDEIVADLLRMIGRLTILSEVREALAGIGVAIVGVVRRTDGWVSTAPNLGWQDVPLGERLAAALPLGVPISVANEADLGALAELRRGAARGADDVIYVSGEVGVGGGLIIDGKSLTGAAGYAGEVGHMPINPSGDRCSCGAIGCWETEVGEGALLRRAGQSPAGGRAAVDAVLAEADAGSPTAKAALDAEGRWLGRGLAGLVNLLNPRLIVLGGLFGRIHPYIAKTLDSELDRSSLSAPGALARVASATLAEDAPLLGAAELAFEPFLTDPAAWLGPRALLEALASA